MFDMKRTLTIVIVAAMSALAGSCTVPPPAPAVEFTGWFREFATCRAEYAAIDARVAAAGVGDAAYFRVPGFPYLRTDRMLASLRDEVHSVDEVGGWIRRMRELDQEAREYEYKNLGLSSQDAAIQRSHFLTCGRGLAGLELDDPKVFARMAASVTPPDEYSSPARLLGLHGLLAPALRGKLEAQQAAARQDLETPATELQSAAPLRSWRAKPFAEAGTLDSVASALPDEMGFPMLLESQWLALAEANAPRLQIETAGDGDRLGSPERISSGLAADTARPQVHYTIGFARFGAARLVQIAYFFWFAADARTSPIDSFIWRVTLDTRFQPLVYESVHASGRDHRWFPAQPLTRRDDADEPALIAARLAPAGFTTLRLHSTTHALRHVDRVEDAGDAAEFELRPYEELFSMPLPSGGTRSLFGPDGLIAGARVPDPLGWWSTGIHEPGTIRQYGHHAIGYLRRQQFDDPRLLESVFIPPSTPAAPAVAMSMNAEKLRPAPPP